MIFHVIKFHFDIRIVSSWPLLVSPGHNYFLVIDNFCEFATNISTKQDKSKKICGRNKVRLQLCLIKTQTTYSPFLEKFSLTSPRVKAVIGSIRLKQSHNASTLHWNFSSSINVLQSSLTPKGFSDLSVEGVLILKSLITALLDVT